MSLGREELQLVVDKLGAARRRLLEGYGDTIRNPAALIEMESALCRLRGSSLFHDDDYGVGVIEVESTDPIDLGASGGRFEANHITALAQETQPPGTPWSPRYYGPPSPEGFHIWGYNAWSTYRVTPQSGNSEPSYVDRYTYKHPVRYTGSSYARVGMWERCRWVSLLNDTGITISASSRIITFEMLESALPGVRAVDPATGLVLDLKAYGHASLVQSFSSAWENIALPTYGAPMTLLECAVTLNAEGGYDVRLVLPYDVPSGKFAHVALYWCSDDDYALSLSSPVVTVAPELALPQTLWSPKNFFRADINSRGGWEGYGISDESNGYLIAKSRTHFSFLDGQYSAPDAPNKYAVSDIPPATPTGAGDSFTGYTPSLADAEVVPVIIVARTAGDLSTGGEASHEVVVGPTVSADFWTSAWEDLPYFPPAPADTVEVARAVLSLAPGAVLGLVEAREGGQNSIVISPGGETSNNDFEASTLYASTTIVWMQQSIPTFGLPPIGDPEATATLLESLIRTASRVRLYGDDTPLTRLAFSLIPRSVGLPRSMQVSLTNMRVSNGDESTSLRGELKDPTRDELQPDSGYASFAFGTYARGVIEDIASLPPSTVMMRIDSDVASLTDERVAVPNTFEVYLDASDRCQPISLDPAGDRLGQDYTLRFVFEDVAENRLEKDLYLTASKFFLSEEEYAQRVASGLTVTGYFKASTLGHMQQFRLHGYAGVIPDLATGDYRVILTRVVSPPDETRQTEEQFRKALENQGLDSEAIDEAVLQFLNSGGQFLVLDLRQYDNKFVSLPSASVCVSRLAFEDRPYWLNNLHQRFGGDNVEVDINVPPVAANLRADSFTVSPSHLQAGALETFGNQSAGVDDPDLNQESNTGSDRPFVGHRLAIRLETGSASSFTSVGLRLKTVGFADNTPSLTPGATIRASIWSSADGIPASPIFVGGGVNVDDIPREDYAEVQIPVSATLKADQVYWLVLEKDAELPSSHFVSLESREESSPADSWSYDVVAGWRPSAGTWWYRVYSGLDEVSPAAFDFSVEGFAEYLVYPRSAFKLSSPSNFDKVRVALGFLPFDGNVSGAPLNTSGGIVTKVVLDSGGVPSEDVQATSSTLPFSSLSEEYSEFEFTLGAEVPAGDYWLVVSPTTAVRGGAIRAVRLGHTEDQLAEQAFSSAWAGQSSDVYRRFYLSDATILGAFNRSEQNVLQVLPPPNDQRTYTGVNQTSPTYKVQEYWQYTLAPLASPAELSIYPRAFLNTGSGLWEYAPRSRDIFVKVKLVVDGRVVEKDVITLPGAPSWLVSFWSRDSSNFKTLITSSAPTSRRVVGQLDFINHTESGLLGQYFNATFEGYFRPLYDGESYTLVLQADAGARVYFGDSAEPVIDTWDAPVMAPVSYAIPTALSQETSYRVYVEYYRAGSSQRMELFWYPASAPTPVYLGSSSALVPPAEPVSLGPELATGIAYLAVGKTASEFATFTDGAPPGDKLVIRSS